MKHKIPNLLKPLDTKIHQKSQFYYPSEPFSFHHFTMRHPVCMTGNKCAFVKLQRLIDFFLQITFFYCRLYLLNAFQNFWHIKYSRFKCNIRLRQICHCSLYQSGVDLVSAFHSSIGQISSFVLQNNEIMQTFKL